MLKKITFLQKKCKKIISHTFFNLKKNHENVIKNFRTYFRKKILKITKKNSN